MSNSSFPITGHRQAPARITRRSLLRWLAAAGTGSGLVACGGGGSSDADPSGEGDGGTLPPSSGSEPSAPFSAAGKGVAGTPVTPAQRADALQGIEAKLSSLFDPATGRASAAGMLDYLGTLPAFKTIGYSATGDVYGVFTDGRPLVVTVDARTSTEGVSDGPPPAASATRGRAQAQGAGRATPNEAEFEAGLPARQFRFLDTWYSEGPQWPAKAWCRQQVDMGDIYMMSGYMNEFGYQQVDLGDGPMGLPMALTVEGLKNVSGDGVFFWTTHGGTLDPDGNIIQGLMTGTTAFQSTVEDTYADEFAEGTLIYYTGPLCMNPISCRGLGGGGVVYTRLAITPKFIRKYRWSFPPYSMAFVNACASATGDMKQAFLDAGVSLYLGWTKPVRVWAMCGAALDFFSLMLGLNENGGANDLPAELNPRQRPYAWGDVIELLREKVHTAYYLDAEDGVVELEPTYNFAQPLGFLALRPSIYWTGFDEQKSEWRLIGGMYGTQKGTAAIGTSMPCDDKVVCTTFGSGADRRLGDPVPVSVDDWKSENIILTIPRTGPGSAGILQLEADGRWSNGVQLTRVSFPIRGTRSFGGSLSVEVNATTFIRSDFRGVRLKPVQELTYLPLVAVQSDLYAAGTWTATGRYSYPQGQETVTVEWSGSGPVTLPDQSSGARAIGLIDPKTRRGDLSVVLQGIGVREKLTYSRPGYADRVETRTIVFSMSSQMPGQAEPAVAVSFSAAYAAGPVTTTFTEPTAGYNEQPATTTIVCGPFTAEFPPEERIGGR